MSSDTQCLEAYTTRIKTRLPGHETYLFKRRKYKYINTVRNVHRNHKAYQGRQKKTQGVCFIAVLADFLLAIVCNLFN